LLGVCKIEIVSPSWLEGRRRLKETKITAVGIGELGYAEQEKLNWTP